MVTKKPTLKPLPEMPKAIQKLSAEWFVGMFECKGTFGAVVTDRGSKVSNVAPYVRLLCDAKDLNLLYRLQEILGCGHVNIHKTYRQNPAKSAPVDSRYVFRVTHLKDLVTKVLPFFERHAMPFAHQARAFEIFRELCMRVQNKEHWSDEGLIRIKEQIRELKACRYGSVSLPTAACAPSQDLLVLDRLLGIFAVNGFFRAQLLTTKLKNTKNASEGGLNPIGKVELSVMVVCGEENQEVLRQFQQKWALRDLRSHTLKKLAERPIKLPQNSALGTQASMVLTVKDPQDVKKVIAFFKRHGLVTDVQRTDFEAFCQLFDLVMAQNQPQGQRVAKPEEWMGLLSQMKGYSKHFRKFV